MYARQAHTLIFVVSECNKNLLRISGCTDPDYIKRNMAFATYKKRSKASNFSEEAELVEKHATELRIK